MKTRRDKAQRLVSHHRVPDRGRVAEGGYVVVPLTDAVQRSGTRVGQELKLVRQPAADGDPASYQFADLQRSSPLLVLTLLFVLAVVLVARWRGLASLVGLGFAGFILVRFMFPR